MLSEPPLWRQHGVQVGSHRAHQCRKDPPPGPLRPSLRSGCPERHFCQQELLTFARQVLPPYKAPSSPVALLKVSVIVLVFG